MKKLQFKKMMATILAIFAIFSISQAQDLFFSEYIEGSGNNKALEIYNGTGADVDLSGYVVKQSHNGAGWGADGSEYYLALSGTIADGDVYVIYATGADDAIVSVGDWTAVYGTGTGQSKIPYFNGDDAMGLFKDGTLIDVIGDPAIQAKWTVAGVATATGEHTLVRKSSVTVGNPTAWTETGGTGSAGTDANDSEWIVYDADNFNFLGYHGPNPANNIESFVLSEQTGAATINDTVHTVNVEVAYGTDITGLTPTITVSYAATISPASGVVQDFTNPVTYTVTAENGDAQDWTVTVTVKPANTETDILSFVLTDQTGDATIDTTNHTVDIEVLNGTDVTALSPEITVSAGAAISPASGVAQDFTDTVTYTVTAEDNVSTQDWDIVVSVAQLNDEANILSFTLTNTAEDSIMMEPEVIDTVNHKIAITLIVNTDATSLIPTIEISAGATISPASGVAQDFTDTVTYTVTAQDGTTTQDWDVIVTVFAYPVVSIYDIQYTTDESGTSPYEGQTVKVSGIVTAVVPGKGFFLQEAPGAWHGIYVFTPAGDIGVVGDSVVFTTTVSEYYDLTELGYVEDYVVVSSNNELPAVVNAVASDIAESMEGVLVHLENYTCVNVDFDTHRNSLYVNDSLPNDTLMVHTFIYGDFEPVLNTEYSFTGIGFYDWGNFKIEPRDSSDIEVLTVVNNAPVIEDVYVAPENPTTDNNEVYVLATITDDVEVISKAFYYGFSADDVTVEVALEPVGFGGVQFRALLPQVTEATTIYYKFEASDVEYTTDYTGNITIETGEAPIIDSVTVSPEVPTYEAVVKARIIDADGISSAVLSWGMDQAYTEGTDTMVTEGNDFYTGTITIPVITRDTVPMYFKITATDVNENMKVYFGTFNADIQGSVNSALVNSISVYPNPVRDFVNIEGDLPLSNIRIITINGSEVLKQNVDNKKANLDLSNLNNGTYILLIETQNGNLLPYKFIKQ